MTTKLTVNILLRNIFLLKIIINNTQFEETLKTVTNFYFYKSQ